MSHPLSILTATAHEEAAEAAEQALAGSVGPGSYRHTRNHRELESALGASPPDLVVWDPALPGSTGPTALELTRRAAPGAPFPVFAAARDEDTALACLGAGAADYVLWEHPRRLGPAAARALAARGPRAHLRTPGQAEVLERIAGGAPLGEALEALVRLVEAQAAGMLGSIRGGAAPGPGRRRDPDPDRQRPGGRARRGRHRDPLQRGGRADQRLHPSRPGRSRLVRGAGPPGALPRGVGGVPAPDRGRRRAPDLRESDPHQDRRGAPHPVAEHRAPRRGRGGRHPLLRGRRDRPEAGRGGAARAGGAAPAVHRARPGLARHVRPRDALPRGKPALAGRLLPGRPRDPRPLPLRDLPRDHRGWRDVHRRGLAGEVVRAEDDRFERADGRVQWLRWEVRPWRAADGGVGGGVIFTEDVTDRKRAESALRESEARLRLTLEAMNIGLWDWNLRTDLWYASPSYLQMLGYDPDVDGQNREVWGERTHPDDEGRQVCGVIRHNTRRMGQLIDDLLALALARVSRSELARETVDMAALAGGAFSEALASGDRDRVEFRLGPLSPAVGDPGLLRQVWANLLGNAVKFSSHRDRPLIEMGSDEASGEVRYWVRDNGAGFDPRYAHQLLGVFQRLHGQGEFEGTGVGLAIVRRIIERHGGRTWAAGEVDRGATFVFALPRQGPGPAREGT